MASLLPVCPILIGGDASRQARAVRLWHCAGACSAAKRLGIQCGLPAAGVLPGCSSSQPGPRRQLGSPAHRPTRLPGSAWGPCSHHQPGAPHAPPRLGHATTAGACTHCSRSPTTRGRSSGDRQGTGPFSGRTKHSCCTDRLRKQSRVDRALSSVLLQTLSHS